MSDEKPRSRHLPGHAKRSDPSRRNTEAGFMTLDKLDKLAVKRFTSDRKVGFALRKAAAAEGIGVETLGERIVAEWLSAHGYLRRPSPERRSGADE